MPLTVLGHVHAQHRSHPASATRRAFVQDNLRSTETAEDVAWVDTDCRPWAGKRELDAHEWQTVDPADNPLDAPTEDPDAQRLAIVADALGDVQVTGNMHLDHPRYARGPPPLRPDDTAR
jgi:hypothetical protein